MLNIIVMDNKLRNNEKGVISIIVTMVFIIVVGLIVLGFGEISRNQSRQTVDNQLSTASYYAAQSVINTILDKIINNQTTTNAGCALSGVNTGIISFNSNSSSKITCASWTNSVNKLIWDDISVNNSKTAFISDPTTLPSGATGYQLKISWKNQGYSNSIPSSCNGDLSKVSAYVVNCPQAGVLKLNITSGPEFCNSKNTPDQSCLKNYSQSLYLIPKSGSSDPSPTFTPATNTPLIKNAAYDNSSNTQYITLNCNLSAPCRYINLRSIYSDSNVSISFTTKDSSGKYIQFYKSQASIDVTAVTNGVARRVVAQANIAKNIPNGSSDFSIVSTKSLCKNVTVSDTSGNVLAHPVNLALNPAPTSGPCISY